MDFILILFVLVVMFVVGARVRRQRRRARAMKMSGIAPTATKTPLLSQRLSDTFSQTRASVQQVWAKRPRMSGPNLAPQMQQWLTQAFPEQPEIQPWLATLSEPQIHYLADQVVIFCLNLNIDPAWLVNHQLDLDSELKQAITLLVKNYVQTLWQAAQLQPDLQRLHIWQAFEENPYGKQPQVFAQKLLTKLVEKEISPALSTNLILATEPERQIYCVQAIRQAAEKYPEAFQLALREVVATLDNAAEQISAVDAQRKLRWFRRAPVNVAGLDAASTRI